MLLCVIKSCECNRDWFLRGLRREEISADLGCDGLRRLVLPIAAIAIALPLIFPGSEIPLAGKSQLFSWHIALSTLAYGSLTIAAFHAVLMVMQESRLHALPAAGGRSGWLSLAIDNLPALLTMERLLFRLIALGFVLLTLTVISGVFFSEQLFGIPFRWEHKTIFTLLSWVLFGILLAEAAVAVTESTDALDIPSQVPGPKIKSSTSITPSEVD